MLQFDRKPAYSAQSPVVLVAIIVSVVETDFSEWLKLCAVPAFRPSFPSHIQRQESSRVGNKMKSITTLWSSTSSVSRCATGSLESSFVKLVSFWLFLQQLTSKHSRKDKFDFACLCVPSVIATASVSHDNVVRKHKTARFHTLSWWRIGGCVGIVKARMNGKTIGRFIEIKRMQQQGFVLITFMWVPSITQQEEDRCQEELQEQENE